jgi:hypothetical protein
MSCTVDATEVATMKTSAFIQQAEREAKLVDALLLARYTLVIHDHKRINSEGETWEFDFGAELEEIDAALQMAGIDTTEALRVPIRRRHDDVAATRNEYASSAHRARAGDARDRATGEGRLDLRNQVRRLPNADPHRSW